MAKTNMINLSSHLELHKASDSSGLTYLKMSKVSVARKSSTNEMLAPMILI